jgi:hypothetical protein
MQDSKKKLYNTYQQLTDNDMDYDEYMMLCCSDQTFNNTQSDDLYKSSGLDISNAVLPLCNIRTTLCDSYKSTIPNYKQYVL